MTGEFAGIPGGESGNWFAMSGFRRRRDSGTGRNGWPSGREGIFRRVERSGGQTTARNCRQPWQTPADKKVRQDGERDITSNQCVRDSWDSPISQNGNGAGRSRDARSWVSGAGATGNTGICRLRGCASVEMTASLGRMWREGWWVTGR